MTLFSALRRAVGAGLTIGAPDAAPRAALYAAIVAEARRPDWYLAGQVPDTLDGRFDMVALVMALVLMRLQDAGEAQAAADLTERFIADMDGSLRQDGVGDQVVGKHIGRMVAALGGRLGAYRETLADDAGFAEALRRNLWRGAAIDDDAVAWVIVAARRLAGRIEALSPEELAAGRLAAA